MMDAAAQAPNEQLQRTALTIRRATTDDIAEIERMVADFVKGHPACCVRVSRVTRHLRLLNRGVMRTFIVDARSGAAPRCHAAI